MQNNAGESSQILGFRATKDFADRFNKLCGKLGCSRSSVMRYALKHFMCATTDSKSVTRVKNDMY